MSQEAKCIDDAAGAEAIRERSSAFARLVASHGVDTLLVSIPRIARMLGYAPSTLYGDIKAGTFFLPYRLIHGSPAVAVDDLIAWLSSRDAEIAPRDLARREAPRTVPSEAWRAKSERMALAAAAKTRLAQGQGFCKGLASEPP